MKTADECGVPLANGPIILDGKNRLSNFYMKSDFVKQLRILGSAQIVLGVISIIANAITMVICRSFDFPGLHRVGYGFWNGSIFILTGMLGVVSGLQRYRFTTILFGLMSILSACLTVALFTMATISAGLCVISPKGRWVYANTKGGSSHYEYGSPEHPDAQRVVIAMEMIMGVVAVVEALVAIRSTLAVRKTGISCCQPDRTSSQPILHFQVGSCFCHCVGSGYLPSYPNSDQLSSTDPEQSLVEGLLSPRDDANEKQSTMMDIKHPLLFYSGTVDQKQQIGPLDKNQIAVFRTFHGWQIDLDGRNRQLRILGSAQIVLGVISIIAHAINMVIFRSFYLPGLPQVGYGFWNGSIFILTGMLGVVSGLQRYRFTTILFGLMSILSACLTVALFALATASAILRCIMPFGRWVYDNAEGVSSHYEYGRSEHPDAQKVAIAMEMIMAVVAVVEAFVAIRSALAVRKTGISCCQPDRTSSQPIPHFQVGSCFCHCVGSCHLPSCPSSDQLSSTDPEQSLVEGLLSPRDDANEKQSTMMDIKHPLLFYSGTVDQKQQIEPLDQNQIDEDSSDRSKLIEE